MLGPSTLATSSATPSSRVVARSPAFSSAFGSSQATKWTRGIRSITSSENGGTVYGSGTANGNNITDTFISTNQYGYDIDKITYSGFTVNGLTKGATYWLNLQNAAVPSGDPVYWDENSGKGCGGAGCPSQASESSVGTIPSEDFTISGGSGSTPEPSSIMLFGSGILGLAGLLRRKLF